MPKLGEVVAEPNKPVIFEFQNGKIKPGEESSLASSLFKDKGTGQKLIGVANGDMVYSGQVFEDSDFNSFLVVQHDDSKKLQLVQVDTTCTVAALLDRVTSTTITPVKAQTLGDLRKQFGSKKAKRYTEQQERLKMNVENVERHLEATVADIRVSELPSTITNEGDSLYKPKINREASSREQVYELLNLVPAEVLNSLEEKVIEILENDDLSEYELIPTVKKNMVAIRASQPEKIAIDKCKILLYIHYLVKFMNTPLKNMTKKFVACDCSEEVDKYIKQNYMVNGSRPISMKDKGLCYTIVLLMLAMDYETDIECLSKDMKIGLKKMQEFARNLGFSQSTKNKNNIVLKIPVPPPIMPNLKRKRT